jgi:hypothetical protein
MHNKTIQDLLVEMFPLVALGNVTMSMGMVCWAVVGAQGRYRLSTSIAITCSNCPLLGCLDHLDEN